MSNQRPLMDRNISINPALAPENTNIPVTPAGDASGQSAYFDSRQQTPSEAQVNSLDFKNQQATNSTGEQSVPRSASIGEQPQQPDSADVDPRDAHPGLHLSGNVISASFCVPYDITHASEGEWILTSRRGTSALFDSFAYLSSPESPWNHTLIGWTGEIKRSSIEHPHQKANMTSMDIAPLNKASAPIPVPGHAQTSQAAQHEGLRISEADRLSLNKQLERDQGGKIIPVWLPDEMDGDVMILKEQNKWRRYAEHELYTLFHYKQNEPTDGRSIRKSWADYFRLNKAFADKILETYKPGDVVLIHDYHLLLLPSLLRQRVPNIYIGFFLHVPFPSSEFYRCLSRRKDVLEGVLGANMVGFQSFSYSRHFSSCSTRVLGFDSSASGVDAYGAHVAVEVFPIGINASATHLMAFNDAAVDEKIAGIRALYAGKKIIVGRDRLDSVRGVAQKLQAFEIFLERHPEWHDKVVLIQVTSPTSVEDKDESTDKTANKISDLVARINGNYGSLSFTPVQHYPQYLSKEEYFALLRVADVGLITSVRDGMNTTALEYVIAQKDNHGPLIISEFSGTAASLGDAIHINPWDLGGTADEIHKALVMEPKQKQVIHEKLYQSVTTNTVQAWISNYLKRLLTNLASFNNSFATPALDKIKLLAQYRKSEKRLFMFDYDGTLTPIVKDPQSAIPSDRVVRTLKTLASDPRNAVWIISGRDQAFLDEWLGHITELGLSAEHGSFLRKPKHDIWENLTEKEDMSWQKKVIEVFQHYTERTQGSFIERKKIAVTWHYRRADPEYGAFQARECRKELENTVGKEYDVEVMPGKANLEVRPRFVNKGEIAKRLIEEYGEEAGAAPEFVFCSGDDFTDEDMFRSLRDSNLPREHMFSVTVGASSKQTLATWHLLEPADVISSIALLNGSTDAGNSGPASVLDGVVPEKRP
ncbi:hypothetical protein AAFC00_001259 [Neodothiora populina]|uniref:Uncharacterized protein n=1 Tax=Neodothiora populina TaxID=2781224 RepID=A0ABR3PNC2_9PEZI